MKVRVLPRVPLPGGVKVARRFVKPFGVGASPTLAANFNSAALLALGNRIPHLGQELGVRKPNLGACPQ